MSRRTRELLVLLGLIAAVALLMRPTRPRIHPTGGPLPAFYTCQCSSEPALVRARGLEKQAAERAYNEFLDSHRDSASGFYHKAQLDHQQGESLAWPLALDRAIALQPGFASCLNLRAYYSVHEPNLSAAALVGYLEDADRAVRLDCDPNCYDTRACVYLRLHQPEDALADLGPAMAADEYGVVSYHRSQAYELLGDRTEAEAALARARQLGFYEHLENYERIRLIDMQP